MTNRVEQAVFWPGLSQDIIRTRHGCMTCHRNAPSQPATPPVNPPSPGYPFQMIVVDYCSLQGHNYLVLADRYSGWLSIFKTGKGDFDGDAMVKFLREYFCTFGVAEEFSSDMGPQMMSDVVQKFLSQWGVHHRQSSAYNPHSNSRAELAVKAGKRMLRDNLDSKGDVTDKFYRALLQYRNTPHSDTRLSPAQVIFGRQVRDFLPVLPYKYEPKQEWGFLQEDRERALARRFQTDGKRLAEHSKTQKQIPVGTTTLADRS